MLGLLARGAISCAGAAWIAGVSKATVTRWCAEVGLKPKEIERRRLAALRAKGERLLSSKSVLWRAPDRISRAAPIKRARKPAPRAHAP